MDISLDATVQRSDEIMHSDLGDQVVMMDVDAGAYYGLNAVGGRIWSMAAEPILLSAVVDRLLTEYEVDRSECAETVVEFASQLVEHGMLRVVAD